MTHLRVDNTFCSALKILNVLRRISLISCSDGVVERTVVAVLTVQDGFVLLVSLPVVDLVEKF